ncbi:SDR family NAD(P)-dependent oxidoreductase [Psychrobacillus sp. OK032]|uniref:SDR family NAD(P)-dependent oxidoreductase n=1 Tax=Psychrobacillus sp. OK032 TaxID=1884358 RepID=UPI0008B36821|nr:glucose 1-dehydrogenase [Psychrobacillus sp. OK032]SES35808.1 NAD(P)-dependent dehydrogenase, short-chain alcohol dehydrogenase family [Psychrobacillus sp. OK032]
MARLKDKVAIITGAAGGQGASEAYTFAREGAKVIATDLQEELLAKTVADINAEFGDVAIAVKHNVASIADWKTVVATAVEKFGKVDVLVNNAGISGNMVATVEDTTEAELNKVIDINLKGSFYGMQLVIPEMKKVGGGSIINVSSVAGLVGASGPAAYSATKGGIRLLSKNVAMDFAKDHIRVNSLHPGYIATNMIKDAISNEDVLKASLAVIPLNFIGDPSDIANAALFLASDESRYVTGTELVVDGGYTAK